jgi:transposase
MPKAYSAQFRDEIIQKLTSPRGPSVEELSAKVGAHKSTLSRWLREATTMRDVTKNDDEGRATRPPRGARRPQDWTPHEKLQVVQEAATLEGSALGGFLRQKGIHEADLSQWREQVAGAALSALSGSPKQRSTDQKRIRKLESELRRKEKALAEAAALLVLSKKAQALWGDDEDVDTTGSDDE